MFSSSIIQIEGFGKWTHGKEEFEILSKQHEIYSYLVKELGKIGCFTFSYLFDNMLAITNNVSSNDFYKVIHTAESIFRFKFLIGHGVDNEPIESVRHAFKDINSEYRDFLPSQDNVVCLHIDIDDYLNGLIVNDLNLHAQNIISEIKKLLPDYIGFHISGDNYMFFTNRIDYEDMKKVLEYLQIKYHVKFGIGITKQSAKAATLSSQAIDHIRLERKSNADIFPAVIKEDDDSNRYL